MIETVLILGLFPAAMAYAAASDLISMTISNRVSLALVFGFAPVAVLVGLPLDVVAGHAAAGALTLVICFGFFARGWIGGGDAKLAAATALWVGWGALLDYALLGSVLGGLLTLALLSMRRHPLPAPLSGQPWLLRLHDTRTGVPYGIALAAAGLIVYPHTVWMRALAG